jgi:Holliday junction resolvase
MPFTKNDRRAGDAAARQDESKADYSASYSELPNRPQARPRGGRRSRNKGIRQERALVRYLQDNGFASERVPLSGSTGGRFCGDISLPLLGVDRCVEVKCRANGFRALYAWLDGRDLLIVRADRREPLVALPLRLAAEIAVVAERNRENDKRSAL